MSFPEPSPASRLQPESLRVDPDRTYAFKSSLKTTVVSIIDILGGWFFPSSHPPIDWNSQKKVAVLRLDHLGDVMMALPALQALENALPNAEVDFFIGPWAKDVLDIAGLRATPRIFPASWFTREGGKKGSVKELEGLLREGRYDAAVELRGDSRHLLAMYRAGIPTRVGLARTGLGFLLTHRATYRPGQHETQRNLDSLRQAGINPASPEEVPRLYPRKEDEQAQKEVRQKLGITRPVIALHAVCSAPSKRWPLSNWQGLIDRLPEEMDIVLIGTEGERPAIEEIQKGCRRKPFVTAGLLTLPALAAFLKDCRLLVGVDSGPAHIAAAVGTPVLSLYSGTNRVEQWGPRGPRVTVLQKKTACSPCELADCPIGNECMGLIQIEEVLKAVHGFLQTGIKS